MVTPGVSRAQRLGAAPIGVGTSSAPRCGRERAPRTCIDHRRRAAPTVGFGPTLREPTSTVLDEGEEVEERAIADE